MGKNPADFLDRSQYVIVFKGAVCTAWSRHDDIGNLGLADHRGPIRGCTDARAVGSQEFLETRLLHGCPTGVDLGDGVRVHIDSVNR
jgi:hypothetical protein